MVLGPTLAGMSCKEISQWTIVGNILVRVFVLGLGLV